MSDPALDSGHLRYSGTPRELTAGSPTVASRETQGGTVLLSVGGEAAEEMGFIPFLL